MPNFLKTVIVRRFLAHFLEIGTTFAVTLILLQILIYVNNYLLGNGDFVSLLNSNSPSFGNLDAQSFSLQTSTTIYQLISGFAIFYFIFTAFNFFFTFSFLYPKNDFQANFFQKIFGFKKFEFSKKRLSHLQKALRMLYREIVLFLSIYGFFGLLATLKVKDVFVVFDYLTHGSSSYQNILMSLLTLFIIFVLPSVILSSITLYKTKGKQLFWDWASSITLK